MCWGRAAWSTRTCPRWRVPGPVNCATGRGSPRSAPPVAGQVHLVVVIDDGRVTGDERIADDSGVDGEHHRHRVRQRNLRCPQAHLRVSGGRLSARSNAGIEEFAEMDALSIPQAQAVARRLAHYRLTAASLVSLESRFCGNRSWSTALLDIRDATAFDPDSAGAAGRAGTGYVFPSAGRRQAPGWNWTSRKAPTAVICGSARIMRRRNGIRKSEFLRTLVLALIATHSPTELNLVLVDFGWRRNLSQDGSWRRGRSSPTLSKSSPWTG